MFTVELKFGVVTGEECVINEVRTTRHAVYHVTRTSLHAGLPAVAITTHDSIEGVISRYFPCDSTVSVACSLLKACRYARYAYSFVHEFTSSSLED